MVNILKFMVPFYGTINDPLPVLPGNEQDCQHHSQHLLDLASVQVCKVHDIVCFGHQSANARSHDILASDISS